jgi:hypothetical protein
LTWPISDSLSATTSCIEERSLSTAKAELEELEEPEPEEDEEEVPPVERPVAAEEPVAELPDPEELEELLLEALVVPLPETTSPTCPESETIVPLCGA